MDLKETTREALRSVEPGLIEMSHRIHANPELSFQEEKAAVWLCEALDHAGFRVERGVCDLPTAFVARTGQGPLNIAICAEYDALPAIGHACGHNIISAAALGAGLLLAPFAGDLGLKLSITGTPAEEGGGGKILMLERGAFDGVNAAMMVHPYPFELPEMPTLAASIFEVHYYGKEAHASAFPELGVNAADALTVAQTAIGLLRQHLRDTDRVHGIVTKGGDAPNIIPAHTSAGYMVRGRTLSEMEEVLDKVTRCFEAGAVATGTRLELKSEKPYAELTTDEAMTGAYVGNAKTLGREMLDMTAAIRKRAASTDMGNVSQVIPSIHPALSVDSYPISNHQPEFTAYAASPAGDKAVLDGALAMAWTAIDMASDAMLRAHLEQKAYSRA